MTAIAKLTGGIIYDDSEGAPITVDVALANARACIAAYQKETG